MKLTFNIIRIITNYIIEVLFPSKCLGCKIKGKIICQNCIFKIQRAEKEIDDKVIAVFQYHDPLIKKILWNLKYYHHPYLGRKLGEIIYDELLEDISDIKIYTTGSPILVIPVPITKNKIKIRGYNQAKKIALGFCEHAEKNLFVLKNNIVTKKIETIPQAKISSRTLRLKNVKNTFEIKNRELVIGKTIIVMDDITTTGSTINEIINLLEKAGAKKVVGFVIAH